MVSDGASFRQVARTLELSPTTVMNWVRQQGEAAAKAFRKQCDKTKHELVEIDELCTPVQARGRLFAGNKKSLSSTPIGGSAVAMVATTWLVVDRHSRNILAYRLGIRETATLKTMFHMFPIKADIIATDDYGAYNSIPSHKRIEGKEHTFTVESKNSQMRGIPCGIISKP